jgi:hypothetical protein
LARICILALCLPFNTMAGLVHFEVTERSPVLQGKSFGATGAYERIIGRAYFAVDPIQQCLPFDQSEPEGTKAFLLFEPVDGADVRMIQ